MCTQDGCSSSYTRKTNLNDHLEKVHGLEIERLHLQKRYDCPFCTHDPFRTVTLLLSHCEREHNANLGMTALYCHTIYKLHTLLGKQELTFSSMNEFTSWREREEEITYTTYVRDTQTYQPKLCEGRYH